MPLKLLNKILCSWLILNIIWIFISFLPHWEVSFLSWANHSLYSLLFLLAAATVKYDTYKRPLFICLALYFLAQIGSVANIFMGKGFTFGNNLQVYQFWLCAQISIRYFGGLAALFLVAHYAFPYNARTAYAALGILATILALYFFAPFFNTDALHQKAWLAAFFLSMFKFSLLPALALLYYGFLLIFRNRPDGAFINSMAFLLFITHFLNITDYIAQLHRIRVYSVDQYFLLVCLISQAVIILLRLNALHATKEQLYEKLIFEPNYLAHIPVISADPGFVRWWPTARKALDRTLSIHFLLGAIYLVLALATNSLYNTIKLTLFVIWIGVLALLVNRQFFKNQMGIVLNAAKISGNLH
jgi:hypothetical protein